MLRWEIKNANLCYGTILALLLLKNLSRAFLARQTPKKFYHLAADVIKV